MATHQFSIKQYYVFLNSKMLVNSGLGERESISAQAMIHCIGESEKSLAVFFLNGDRQGEINDSDKWPNRSEISGNRVRAEIFAPISQYPMYLDLLRNENPVFAFVDSTQPFRNRLESGGEVVGEGEYF